MLPRVILELGGGVETKCFFVTKWVIFTCFSGQGLATLIRGGVEVGGALVDYVVCFNKRNKTIKKTTILFGEHLIKMIDFPVTTVEFIWRLSSLVAIRHFYVALRESVTLYLGRTL